MNLLERKLTRRQLVLGGIGAVVTLLGLGEAIHLAQQSADNDSDTLPEAEKQGVESLFADTPTLDIDFRDGQPLDPAIWNYELGVLAGHDNEQQFYTNSPRNIGVRNGVLEITAHKEAEGEKPYSSAWIDTKGKFDFMYGKIEVVMKLPKGAGTWPAGWVRTTDTPYTNGATAEEKAAPNFYIQNGELDFMEEQGAKPGVVNANVHTYNSKSAGNNPNVGAVNVPDASDAFHAYGMEWAKDFVAFTLDGKEYHRVTKTSDEPHAWPFDHRFNLVINLAMGGASAEKLKQQLNLPFEHGIDDSQEEHWTLAVQSVKYFPLKAA